MDYKSYSIELHKHILSCWCAATAASTQILRFEVSFGSNLLELGHPEPKKNKQPQAFIEYVDKIRQFESQSQFDK